MTDLSIGNQAPDFDLPCSGGGRLRLSHLKGKAIVLFFYPEDGSPSCTKEAQDFAALAGDFAKAGAVLVGLSTDSVPRHDKFKAKHGLPMDLVSDEDHAVADAYGLWVEKQMYGRKYMGLERATLLLDVDGRVAAVWRKVKVKDHAAAVLEAVRALTPKS
jgi:peroxiredoxin Q/BCP